MGQGVHKDGTLGEEFSAENLEEFNNKITELLKSSEIDHVRVFNKEDPESNQVGLSQIEEKDLDEKIEKLVDKKMEEKLKKMNIMKEYQDLHKQIMEKTKCK